MIRVILPYHHPLWHGLLTVPQNSTEGLQLSRDALGRPSVK